MKTKSKWIDSEASTAGKVLKSDGSSGTSWEFPDFQPIHIRTSDFIESLDGGSNNIDVDKLIDGTNTKVGKRVTGNADNQDVNFDVLVLLPKNFPGFDTNAIGLDFRASDITGNNGVSVKVYGTNGVLVDTFDLTPTSANTWQTKNITSASLSGGTFSADSMFRIEIIVTIDSTDTIDISDGKVNIA